MKGDASFLLEGAGLIGCTGQALDLMRQIVGSCLHLGGRNASSRVNVQLSNNKSIWDHRRRPLLLEANRAALWQTFGLSVNSFYKLAAGVGVGTQIAV
jgi:hypothetical protein